MIRSTLSLALLLLLASRSSFALQVLEAKDGETMLAKISRKEISRISVEHGRIRKVTGNAGEFVLEKDDETGQVFVRPSNIESSKPLNLFVAAEQDTFALLLQPVDTPSETILIRPAAHKRDPATSAVAAGHIRRLKNLLLVMASAPSIPWLGNGPFRRHWSEFGRFQSARTLGDIRRLPQN